MFGGEDPFASMFGQMRRQMDMMDRMMDSVMDPFGMMGMGIGPRYAAPSPFGMLEDAPHRQVSRPPGHQLANPFDPFGGLGFGGIFNAMNDIQTHAMNDPHSHVYSHSTVMTFGPDGQPRVMQSSTRKAGDARETRRRMQDGERDEVEIGHTIGERTHIIEKKRDKDGNVRSQQKFVNLDEDDAVNFDREFQNRVRRNFYGSGRGESRSALENGYSSGIGRRNSDRYGTSSSGVRDTAAGSRTSAPIITLPEEEEDMPEQERSRARTSSYTGGPIIREISEEEAESSISKRRKDNGGRYFPGNN